MAKLLWNVNVDITCILSGAPEAVLDWGGKDLRGLTIFFCQGLISGVASFLVCRGGGGTKCIDKKLHIGRAEVFVIIIFLT